MSSNHRHDSRKSRPWQPLKRFMQGLFRFLFRITGRRFSQAGFVFPTTLLLVLMVLLTVSALTFRSFSRSTQIISQREQQVIYNAATPAIDRAKAKLEFLFQEDDRFPGAPPTSDFLANMMLPPTARIPNVAGSTLDQLTGFGANDDPYKLPDEQRLDVNNDGRLDNAWSFPADANGNGTIETGEIAVYSILVDHESGSVNLKSVANQTKANALVTRTGPVATTEAIGACPSAAVVEEGWQVVDSSSTSDIQKNFQITAFVTNNRTDVGKTFESLEFQQSRISSRANKWGAWFRYDLELLPGADFKWNGAMHTDGSLIVADLLKSYMLTSHNSCLYNDRSSEITLGEAEYDTNGDNTIDATFQGQAIQGSIQANSYGVKSDPDIHLFNGNGTKPTTGNAFGSATDSVTGGAPADVAMNPIVLYLKDRSEHIQEPSNSGWKRDANWENRDFVKKGRIVNDPTSRPYVDDFYRADNRWGPKPRYDSRDDDLSLDKSTSNTSDDNNTGDPISSSFAKSDKLINPTEGLDGYWERRAIREGLRLIVGERLELGNTNGWNYDPSGIATGANVTGDPLYPPKARKGDLTTNGNVPGDHEYRQHKSLRDNLAAVQSMVVYHYDINGGTFPAACMAVTAHPGTGDSLVRSRTFAKWYEGGVRTDFFNGQGTNGWEFKYHNDFDTAAEFADEVVSGKPLGNALRNLAYFAGDPNGGAPSFPPIQDNEVHPFPYQAMWGDFAVLRRIIDGGGLDSAANFNALSPADKATVHSAACTLGLLAYNMEREIAEYDNIDNRDFRSLNDITQRLNNVVGAITAYMLSGSMGNQYKVGNKSLATELTEMGYDRAQWAAACPSFTIANPSTFTANNGKDTCGAADYFYKFKLADWIRIAPYASGNVPADSVKYLEEFSTQVNRLASLIRDRDLGFKVGTTTKQITPTNIQRTITWDDNTGYTQVINVGTGNYALSLRTKCDPNVFRSLGAGGGGGDDNVLIAGIIGCSNRTEMPVRFPALYYLFPLENHDHDGAGAHQQPAAEEYVAQSYISTQNSAADRFKIVSKSTASTDAIIRGVKDIAAVPAPLDPASVNTAVEKASWVLPFTNATVVANKAALDTATNAFNINTCGTQETCFNTLTKVFNSASATGKNVPFLDKGIFNGREQVALRVLDIDVDAITKNKTGTGNNDYWLPSRADDPNSTTDFATKGIVYAYREDAVREDEIVRPAGSGTNCAGKAVVSGGTFRIETINGCKMRVQPGTSIQDPPLQDNKVSMKPVDFLPDPDRRPYGFRFKTTSGDPADFSGVRGGNASTGRQAGMTFVTDNAAYIQGNFNLHSNNGTTSNFLEEFTYTLQNRNFGENDFYDQRTADKLNLNSFAKLTVDHWRPVEILTDALTVLSSNFKDGAIEDAFINSNNITTSSYAALNRPKSGNTWLRENPNDTTATTPIWVDRNGTFYIRNASGAWDEYYDFLTNGSNLITMNEDSERRSNIPDATTTYVNAVFVSGIVPSRPNQYNGGLHNYPRFLEKWGGQDLFINGSFIQLNFSTSAVAPFDQDTWEYDDTVSNNEWAYFYTPPNRRWGFDVGLLYNPPAPAAERFNEVGRERSEYYRVVPADDPYVKNLRCAKNSGGQQVLANFCQ